jgi:hypothetical protein
MVTHILLEKMSALLQRQAQAWLKNNEGASKNLFRKIVGDTTNTN